MTQFLRSITPLSTLRRRSLQRPRESAPLAVRRAISLPFSHPLSSVLPRISLIYAVQDVTSFVGLMVLFPRISFEIFSLCVPSRVVLVLFRESTHFSLSFAGCKDGGCWSVLGPLVEQEKVNLKLTSLAISSVEAMPCNVRFSFVHQLSVRS